MNTSKIVTHNGKLHNDEVCAIALLRLVGVECDVVRTRDAAVIEAADYVVDVGGVYNPQENRFDHHQPDYIGIKSSAGMVYSWITEEYDCYAPVMEYKASLGRFVSEVDYRDLNGPTDSQVHHKFFELINEMNQQDIYDQGQDDAFLFAVDSYISYINNDFVIPEFLREVAGKNKTAKAVDLARRVSELHYWNLGRGGKIHSYHTEHDEYVPAQDLPEDWDIFVSWDKGQKAYTVLCNTDKGIVLAQNQDDHCVFVHKAGFIGKFKSHGWREQQQLFMSELDVILNDGTKLSIPVGEEYW